MTQNTQKILSSRIINIGDNLADFLDSGHDNLNDWLHEYACVIYYARIEKEVREEIETAVADLAFVQEYYEEEDEEKFDAIIEAINYLDAL